MRKENYLRNDKNNCRPNVFGKHCRIFSSDYDDPTQPKNELLVSEIQPYNIKLHFLVLME